MSVSVQSNVGDIKVTLRPMDTDEVITVNRKIIEKSVLIKLMIDDLGETEFLSVAVPIDNVKEAILHKAIEWCEKYPTGSGAEGTPDHLTEWDVAYFAVSAETLFDIIMAANFLDIPDLLSCGCKVVANMIRGKSPDEIREIFGIENDFTEEEQAEMAREMEDVKEDFDESD